MSVRPDGTHVLPGQNRICQNHFFKIQFSFAEKFEGTDVFIILWDSCVFFTEKFFAAIVKAEH